MGVSIDMHIYNAEAIKADIVRVVRENGGVPEGRVGVEEFCEKILPRFGTFAGDKYVTLWNEYWSESGYNAGSELFRTIELYYGVEDVFLSGYDYGGGANAEEELQEVFGEDVELFEQDEY